MEKWGPAFRLIGVGFFIGACIVAGVLVGLWLDRRFDTLPIFVLVGLVVGLIAASWGVYQMLLPLLKESGTKNNKKERR
jgi:F0F1-type ATP synthase assembly protein I